MTPRWAAGQEGDGPRAQSNTCLPTPHPSFQESQQSRSGRGCLPTHWSRKQFQPYTIPARSVSPILGGVSHTPFYAPTHFPPTKTHWTQKWGGQPSLRSCQQDFAPQFPTPPKPLTSSGGEILHSRREAFSSLLTPTPPPPQAGGENARFVRLTWPIVQPPGARWGLHCACHTEPGTSPTTKHTHLYNGTCPVSRARSAT